jgi:hypothetical protein
MAADHRLHRGGVAKVATHHHRHVLRPVPAAARVRVCVRVCGTGR